MATSGKIRIGIGGWTYEPWRGTFYPDDLAQKNELAWASRRLGTIEVNGTYYRSQKRETFAKWRDETPDGFVFALKAPRFATNRRVLAEAGDSISRFFDSGVAELGDKLGPINWQFMATKAFQSDDFAAFLDLLPDAVEGRRLRHAVEVRHDSFRTPEFIELVRRRGVAVVRAEDSDYPNIPDITADFVYARAMGTREGEDLGYGAAELDALAVRARTWAEGRPGQGDAAAVAQAAEAGPRDVYLYFITGHKVANPAAAMALQARLATA